MKHWLIEHGVYVVLSLALCGAGIYFLLHLTRDADANSAALLVTQGKLDTVLDKINQPCIPVKGQHLTADDEKNCGTLADLNQTLHTIRAVAGQVETAAKHENKNLDTLDKQEATLATKLNAAVDGIHGLSVALTGTANAATQTLHGASLTLSTMNNSIAATKPLIEASTATLGHIDSTLPTLSETAVNVKHMTADGARISKDAADEADKLAHPAKKKLGFWGGVWVGMQYVHKMMPSIF